jgi:hypothetical protein
VLVQVVVSDALLTGLSGLLKTAALENPHVRGQIVLVPGHTTAEELAARLQSERVEDAVVRYEQNVRQVRNWQEVQADAEASIAFKNDGVYRSPAVSADWGRSCERNPRPTREARIVLTAAGHWTRKSRHASMRSPDV